MNKVEAGYYIIMYKDYIYINIMENIIKSMKMKEFYKLIENRSRNWSISGNTNKYAYFNYSNERYFASKK